MINCVVLSKKVDYCSTRFLCEVTKKKGDLCEIHFVTILKGVSNRSGHSGSLDRVDLTDRLSSVQMKTDRRGSGSEEGREGTPGREGRTEGLCKCSEMV